VLDADVEVDRREFTVRAALQVAPGERLALFGPSGAGKTTLLEVIAGLVPPRRGHVELGGRVLTSTAPPVRAVPPWQRRVGLLRQDPGLFPHLSVRDNLCYAPSASPTEAELSSLASLLGIGSLLAAMPARLSGGQAHRVALGRLLLAHCDTLLLDEPYTGLDASLRRTLTHLVASLVAERSVPTILVTHDLADAQAFADRLAVLDRGALLQVGAPDEVVLRPGSRRVAELVGYLGFVPSGQRIAGVHPERVITGAFGDRGLVLTGTVAASRPAGAGWEADLSVAGAAVTCRLPDKPPASGGEFVVTVLDPPYFGSDGSAATSAPAGGGGDRGEQQVRRLRKWPSTWRSKAIEIAGFYPGNELPPALMTERNAPVVGIRRTADQDQVAQDSDLDTRTTVTSPGAAPSRFVHGLTTHYSPEGYHEERNILRHKQHFLPVSILQD
jgi:ABC-type sulfate/molybdate transport systems ATPase subunit